MNKHLKKFGLLIILGLFLVGCTTPTQAPPPANGGETPAAETKVIGLSMPEIKGSFWTAIYYGVTEEAKALGYEVIAVEAGGFQNVDKQISQIEDLIQREVDILLVGATSAEGIGPIVEEAIASGIPVIGISSLPKTDQMIATVGADHYGMGALLAQCIGEAIGGEGEVAMAAGPSGVSYAVERGKGFKETMASEFPGITIVSELNTPTGRDQGVTLAEDWLQKFPNLKGIYTVTDDSGAGAADTLAAAGREGDIVIGTCNLSPIGKEYLQSGKIKCEAIQTIVTQGRMSVQVADAYFKGEAFEKKTVTPVILVTLENLTEIDLSEFQAPEGYVPDL